jgi:DNA-binding CsgD family transcriptional regulator
MKASKANVNLYLEIIEKNLSEICSPFLLNISSKYLGLTSREIQIAQLIKEKKTSKEIADILVVSVRTVNFHRNNLRKKFGLKSRQSNLISHLLTLE